MFVVLWIGFSILVGYAANNRNRSGAKWFFFALCISPLLAGLFLLASKEVSTDTNNANDEKKCLYCAEIIKREASKCKHCGADLPVV